MHHLYVAKGSRLEHQYCGGDVRLLTLRDYVELACDFLERTPSDVVVQRLTGEVAEPYVVAPHWGVTKLQVIHQIREEFRRRGSRQGSRVKQVEAEAQVKEVMERT